MEDRFASVLHLGGCETEEADLSIFRAFLHPVLVKMLGPNEANAAIVRKVLTIQTVCIFYCNSMT